MRSHTGPFSPQESVHSRSVKYDISKLHEANCTVVGGRPYNGSGRVICGVSNLHNKPCHRIGRCPFHPNAELVQSSNSRNGHVSSNGDALNPNYSQTCSLQSHEYPVPGGSLDEESFPISAASSGFSGLTLNAEDFEGKNQGNPRTLSSHHASKNAFEMFEKKNDTLFPALHLPSDIGVDLPLSSPSDIVNCQQNLSCNHLSSKAQNGGPLQRIHDESVGIANATPGSEDYRSQCASSNPVRTTMQTMEKLKYDPPKHSTSPNGPQQASSLVRRNDLILSASSTTSGLFSSRRKNLPKRLPCKKSWTKKEHFLFLRGLQMFGRGSWKQISTVVKSRNPTQIQSHAQKYFLRQKQEVRKKNSIHDISFSVTELSEGQRSELFIPENDVSSIGNLQSHATTPNRSTSSLPDLGRIPLHGAPFASLDEYTALSEYETRKIFQPDAHQRQTHPWPHGGFIHGKYLNSNAVTNETSQIGTECSGEANSATPVTMHPFKYSSSDSKWVAGTFADYHNGPDNRAAPNMPNLGNDRNSRQSDGSCLAEENMWNTYGQSPSAVKQDDVQIAQIAREHRKPVSLPGKTFHQQQSSFLRRNSDSSHAHNVKEQICQDMDCQNMGSSFEIEHDQQQRQSQTVLSSPPLVAPDCIGYSDLCQDTLLSISNDIPLQGSTPLNSVLHASQLAWPSMSPRSPWNLGCASEAKLAAGAVGPSSLSALKLPDSYGYARTDSIAKSPTVPSASMNLDINNYHHFTRPSDPRALSQHVLNPKHACSDVAQSLAHQALQSADYLKESLFADVSVSIGTNDLSANGFNSSPGIGKDLCASEKSLYSVHTGSSPMLQLNLLPVGGPYNLTGAAYSMPSSYIECSRNNL